MSELALTLFDSSALMSPRSGYPSGGAVARPATVGTFPYDPELVPILEEASRTTSDFDEEVCIGLHWRIQRRPEALLGRLRAAAAAVNLRALAGSHAEVLGEHGLGAGVHARGRQRGCPWLVRKGGTHILDSSVCCVSF